MSVAAVSQPIATKPDSPGSPKMAYEIVISVLGLSLVATVGAVLSWGAIKMTVDVTQVAGILAPVVFAAAVVERAIEILVSPWRDGQAALLQAAVDQAKQRLADPNHAATDLAALDQGMKALTLYKAQTQRIAFAVGFTMSALIGISGVHALGGFVAPEALAAVSDNQRRMFIGVDVGLTALLLSGGADGIHSVVNAVTRFFNATRPSKP